MASKLYPLNIISSGIETVYSGETTFDNPPYILKAQLIKGRPYIPILMVGKFLGLQLPDYRVQSLFLFDTNTFIDKVSVDTALQLLKVANNKLSSKYSIFELDRNSTFYGNSNILIDNKNNVLYISCYDLDWGEITVFINKEALYRYGALSKAILSYFITSLSASDNIDSKGRIPLNAYYSKNRDDKHYTFCNNIEIIRESVINDFISEYPLYDETTPDDVINFQLKTQMSIDNIKDNLFV